MFVLIDIDVSNDAYSSFGDTLDEAIAMWESDCAASPSLMNEKKVMIVQGIRKIAKVTYINAPTKKKTVALKKPSTPKKK